MWNGILPRILAAGLLDAIVSSTLFHNGTDSRIFLPLRYVIFHYTIATDSLDSIASPAPFHNGSVFRDSLPLRYIIFRRTLSTDLLDGIASLASFHNGSISRNSLPLREPCFAISFAIAHVNDTVVPPSLFDSFRNGTDSRISLQSW